MRTEDATEQSASGASTKLIKKYVKKGPSEATPKKKVWVRASSGAPTEDGTSTEE
jgi:FMN-dependent NADH-azoreductase